MKLKPVRLIPNFGHFASTSVEITVVLGVKNPITAKLAPVTRGIYTIIYGRDRQ